MIYFIKDTNTQAIKIGYSKRPENRVSDLQTGNPSKLILLGTVPGMKVDEDRYHFQFAQYRLEGEWFKGDIIEAVLTILAEHRQQIKIRRMAMSEITISSAAAESTPLPEEGTLANDSGVVGVCRIPGLRLKSFSLKLTERKEEVPPFEEMDVGTDPQFPPSRQNIEYMKKNHYENWERQRDYAENGMWCGFDLRYLLVLESDLTNDDLEQLRNAILSLSTHAQQRKGLCHKFYDEDNAVIPFFVSPTACHIVGGRDAITGTQGDAFRVVVIYETRLMKELPKHHAAAKIKDVFTGENYAGEHPLVKAKKFVISVC